MVNIGYIVYLNYYEEWGGLNKFIIKNLKSMKSFLFVVIRNFIGIYGRRK